MDDDNDGIPDAVEIANALNAGDTDGDGTPDHRDLDSDGDGIPDLWESGLTMVQIKQLDANADGRIDSSVTFGANGFANVLETSAESGVAINTPVNSDGVGSPDYLDLDSDNDGVNDVREAGGLDANGNALSDSGLIPAAGTDSYLRDTDCDGIPDHLDLDSDSDGLFDIIQKAFNLASADANDDGRIDSGVDVDLDGIMAPADSNDALWGESNDVLKLALPSGTQMLNPATELLLGLTFDAWNGTSELPCNLCPAGIAFRDYYGPGGLRTLGNISTTSTVQETVTDRVLVSGTPEKDPVWQNVTTTITKKIVTQPTVEPDPSICELPPGGTSLQGANASRCYMGFSKTGNPYNSALGADQNGISLVTRFLDGAEKAYATGFYFEAAELTNVSAALNSQMKFQLVVYDWNGGDVSNPANVNVLYTSDILRSNPNKTYQRFRVNFDGVDTTAWIGKQVIFQVIPWTNTGEAGTGMARFDDLALLGFCSDQPTLRLGDQVWLDTNADGIFNNGESGIAGVAMQLFRDSGNGVFGTEDSFVAETNTGSNGVYQFNNLQAGNYFVRIKEDNFQTGALAGLQPTPAAPVSGNSNLNNFHHGQVNPGFRFTGLNSSLVTLGDGEPTDDGDDALGNLTIDFGFVPLSTAGLTIGNLVWNDTNNNGLRDSGEPVLTGVRVELYQYGCNGQAGTFYGSATTNASGNYLFTNLPPGDYMVIIPASNFGPGGVLVGYSPSRAPLAAPSPNTDIDNDSNGTMFADGEVRSGIITLTLGNEPINDGDTDANTNLSIDFGFNNAPNPALLSLGNFVWRDNNANGLQNVGEPAIPGVLLTLWRDDGDGIINPEDDFRMMQTTTDSAGLYRFVNLLPGRYYVWVEPGNFQTGGPLFDLYSTLDGGAPDGNANNDDNGLDNSQAMFVGLITDLITLTVGQEPINDGDTNANTNLTLDFGFYPPSATPPARLMSLGNLIWHDLNDNAIRDAGEPALPNVRINLFRDQNQNGTYDSAVDTFIGFQTTNASGNYLFTGLQPGIYLAQIAASNWAPGGALEGYVSSSSSSLPDFDVNNFNVGNSRKGIPQTIVEGLWASGVITMIPGTEPINDGDTDPNTNLAIDWGFFKPLSIGDYVWRDTNNNGSLDAGEQAVPGIVVQLVQDNGDGVYNPASDFVLRSTITNQFGNYGFGFLAPANYFVVLPALNFATGSTWENWRSSTGSVGELPPANNTDHGIQLSDTSIVSAIVALTPGGEPDTAVDGGDTSGQWTIDFGIFPLGKIGNLVWHDQNNNGLKDAAETGISGITLELLDGSGTVLGTTLSDSEGKYCFTSLYPGDYQVRITTPPSGQPSSSTITVTTDNRVDDDDNGTQSTPGGQVTSPLINVSPEETDNTIDFGFNAGLGSLGNQVWFDTNNNGLLDSGETGIGGIAVQLYTAGQTPGVDTPIATTTTSGSGFYLFENLVAGGYIVYLPQPPANYPGLSSVASTTDNQVDHNNNGIQPVFGGPVSSTTINLSTAETDLTIDFGFTCHATWQEWQFLNPLGGDNAPSGNPDGDRVDNLLEYGLLTDPESGVGDGFCIRPSVTAPGTLEAVFNRPTGATVNVTYILKHTNVLTGTTTWTPITLDGTNTTVVDNGNWTETVTISDLETLTGHTAGTGFVRLCLELDATSGHTSETEVEGWKETALGLCCQTYNVPFQRCVTFSGTVDSISGQALTFTGESLAALLDPARTYYAEVISGDNAGQRFDIVSATGATVTLANDSDVCAATAPFNTLTGAPPATLVGDTLAIRPHWTVGEVFPPAGFGATNSQTTADQIQVQAGGAWKIYWLYANSGNPIWVDTADAGLNDQGGTVLPPGQGVFFNNRTAASTVLSYGEVRANRFVRPLCAGLNLLGGGYPVTESPALRGMDNTTFTGTTSFATADNILIWNNDATQLNSNNYTTRWLLNGTNPYKRWVKIGDSTVASEDNNLIFAGDRASFIRRATARATFSYPAPWAP